MKSAILNSAGQCDGQQFGVDGLHMFHNPDLGKVWLPGQVKAVLSSRRGSGENIKVGYCARMGATN